MAICAEMDYIISRTEVLTNSKTTTTTKNLEYEKMIAHLEG